MKCKALAAGVALAMLAGPALAGNTGKDREVAGMSIGAVIGAAAGGPAGFIVGAAAGAWLGDAFQQKSVQVESLTVALGESRAHAAAMESRVAGLDGDLGRLNEELDRLRAMAAPELLNLLKSGIEMDLPFRTDEHVLADTTGSRLRELAATLASTPELRVQLDGYADERGATDYNRRLSVRRADHVREVLEEAGVPADRIVVAGHGESQAADASADSLALERRVSLTLYIGGTPSLAANPTARRPADGPADRQ